jgi:hypothetical protein
MRLVAVAQGGADEPARVELAPELGSTRAMARNFVRWMTTKATLAPA